jgi:hypothetical protein
LDGVAKGWFFGNCFAAGIDHVATDGRFLRQEGISPNFISSRRLWSFFSSAPPEPFESEQCCIAAPALVVTCPG